MEKDKLQLIKTIITLVDTEEGLKQIRDTVTKVLQTQWNKEEEDKKEALAKKEGKVETGEKKARGPQGLSGGY